MGKRQLTGCAATSAAERAKRMQTTHPSVRESPSRAASPRGGSAGTGGATSGPRTASPRHSGSASMRTLAQQKKRQGKGKESALRTAVSPPSAQTSMRLEVDVERYIQAAQVLPKFMLPFGKARDRERKKLVTSHLAQKKEMEQKHINALKAFDKHHLAQEMQLEEEMKPEALLEGFVGLRVRKSFKGHGIFGGHIVSLRRDPDHVPLFLVRYEDGDEEEVFEEELEQMRSAERKAEAAAAASSAVNTPRKVFGHLQH